MTPQMPVTLPDHLEAIMVHPNGEKMGVFRNGDLVDTDWKVLQIRIRREISHPTMRVPWGELFIMSALSALVFKQFGWTGLLITGAAIWTAQRITNHVTEEIEDRKRIAAQRERDSSKSAE
jgi:hypothetical protein